MVSFTVRHSNGNQYMPFTPEHRVYEVAQDNGKSAASWVDTSTNPAAILKGIEDCDPMVMDAFRVPDLSGEYADDYSERDLLSDAGWVEHDGTALRDALVEQYLTDVSDAFWSEVERMARIHV